MATLAGNGDRVGGAFARIRGTRALADDLDLASFDPLDEWRMFRSPVGDLTRFVRAKVDGLAAR